MRSISVVLDEAAHNEPSHLNLRCLQLFFYFGFFF